MHYSELRKNAYYTDGAGEVRFVTKAEWDIEHSYLAVDFNHLSGAEPMHGVYKGTANDIGSFGITGCQFLDWASHEIPHDSFDAVEAISLSAEVVRRGIDLKLGETYWSGGDCLRKVSALEWDERGGLVNVRFRHVLGEDGRVSEECDELINDLFWLREEEFLNRPTVLVNFSAETLQAWLSSENPCNARQRIFDVLA